MSEYAVTDKGVMDVIIDGVASSRLIDHYAVAHPGNDLASGFGYPVPVLYDGEEIQRTINGKIYIYTLSAPSDVGHHHRPREIPHKFW
jgi:hypothetical protein